MVKEQLVSFPLKGIFHGVSQQPATIRREGFAEAQENGYSSIVDGLTKRPPVEHVGKLKTDAGADTDLNSVHFVDRGADDQHVIVIEDEAIAVYGLDGTAKTVHKPDGETYLGVGASDDQYKFLTLADVTFVLNPNTETAMHSDLSPSNDAITTGTTGDQCLAFLTGSAGTGDYKIIIATDTYTVADTGDTFADAASFAAAIDGDTVSGVTYAAESDGPVVWIYRNGDVGSIDVTAKHTKGDEYISVIKDSVVQFTDLPVYAPHDFLIEVTGSPESGIDDYYVKFSGKNNKVAGDMEEGQWVEDVAPGIPYRLNRATMPHILFKNSDGTYTFAKADGDFGGGGVPVGPATFKWGEREAGDALTNKDPLFVGSKVRDMVFHKNRVGFVTNDDITLSEGGEFFNFFLVSAIDTLATDRINLTINHSSAVNFHTAITFQDDLLVFGENDQFRVTGTPILTGDTAQATLLSSYRSNQYARPVVSAKRIFFSFSRGDYAGIYQLMPSGTTFGTTIEGQYTDNEITLHVPRYIPGNIRHIAAFGTEGLVCALSSTDNDALYIYKYFTTQKQDVQTSWSKFTFANSNIRGIGFANNALYMVNRRADGWYLEKMTFNAKQVDSDSIYVTHLDRRLKDTDTGVVATYSSVTDRTTFSGLYTIGASVNMEVVTRFTSSVDGGERLTVTAQVAGGTTVEVSGNYATTPVWIGEQYTMTYQMSPPMLRDQNSQRINEGRLQLRRGTVEYSESGFFQVEVTPDARDAYTYTFTGRSLGAAGLLVGSNPVASGTFPYGIMCRADNVVIKILNDSPLPSTVSALDFEGTYTARAARVQ